MESSTQTATESSSGTVTFGRTLVEGEPVDDGLMFPVDSPPVELLAGAASPLISNPVLGEYGAALVQPKEVDGEYMKALAITPPGATGPAEHYHPDYDERFEVVEGEFVFEVDGEPRTLGAGESVTVEAGTPHTLRNESESHATCVLEARPEGRLTDVVQLLFGLAHDGKLPESGQPSFFQAMVMAKAMGDDTVFTSPPPIVQRMLATVFGPIGRLLGYRATYPNYEDDAFWETRVEQLHAR